MFRVALLNTGTAVSTIGTSVRCCRSPLPTVSTQQRDTKAPLPAAGKRWSSRLTALAAPWPWQQRCGNSCARSWKYVNLNHWICGRAAKNRAVCGVFVSWCSRCSPMGIACVYRIAIKIVCLMCCLMFWYWLRVAVVSNGVFCYLSVINFAVKCNQFRDTTEVLPPTVEVKLQNLRWRSKEHRTHTLV